MPYMTKYNYRPQIIKLIAEGKTNKEIWMAVGCNPKYPTVVRRYLNEMAAEDRDKLIRECQEGKYDDKPILDQYKDTFFKQKIFILLHDGFTGSSSDLADRFGCNVSTSKRYMGIWNRMSPEDQEKEYQEAKALISRHKAEIPPDRQLPSQKSSLNGFHTPNQLPKNRIYISHY